MVLARAKKDSDFLHQPYWRSAPNAKEFSRVLFRTGDLQYAERINQCNEIARRDVAVGTAKIDIVTTRLDHRVFERVQVFARNISDEITEMVAGDDDSDELRAALLGRLDDRGDVVQCRLPEIIAIQCARCDRGCQGCEYVAPVKCCAHVFEAASIDDRVRKVIDLRVRTIDGFGDQAVVRREKCVTCAERQQHVTVGSDAGIDDRQVHRAGRKIVIRSRDPKPCFGRPVNMGFMGQINDRGRRKTADDHAFHGPDERPAVTEIGGNGNDAAWLEWCAHHSPM